MSVDDAVRFFQELDEPAKPDANTPIRMYIALRILRAWNNGTAGFDGLAVKVVNDWIDQGMKGPIPWPESPFFAEWAKDNGYSKVGDYVGFVCFAIFVSSMPSHSGR